jgi:hypothetical protein
VYKAKIGRDAITDIHVRRYSSKPYYFHPKSTGVSGKRVQGRTHISSGGPSKIRRQTDIGINVSISTSQSAQQRRRQVPLSKYRTATPHHTKVTTADFASLYLRLSHKQRKEKRRKFNIPKRDSLKTCWVPNPSTLRPGSRFVNRPRASWKAGTGPLALSCRNCPSPTREVGSPERRDLSHRVSFRRP